MGSCSSVMHRDRDQVYERDFFLVNFSFRDRPFCIVILCVIINVLVIKNHVEIPLMQGDKGKMKFSVDGIRPREFSTWNNFITGGSLRVSSFTKQKSSKDLCIIDFLRYVYFI